MSARSSRRSVSTETKCQGPGLAKSGPRARSLTALELEDVDAALSPWARGRAEEIRLAGVRASVSRREVVSQVWAELEPAPLSPAELARRRARRQGRLPWAPPVRGVERPDPAPRMVKLAEHVAHYEFITECNPWHRARSESLRRGLVAKLRRCGSRELTCMCRRCGVAHRVESRCDDRFCFSCSRTFYGRLRRRLIHSSHAHMAGLNRAERGRLLRVETCEHCKKQHPEHARGRSRPQLWTLTVAHDASTPAEETRATITKGWVRLRAWLQKQFGRSVPYALVWEWTRGSGSHGAHVHAHVLVLAPPLCWQRLSQAWQRATGGRGAGVGHPRPLARGRAHRAQKAAASLSATSAATYIAKYASKGSAVLEGEEADAVLLADVWRASYARRRVTASQGWWLRTTRVSPCCAAGWVVALGVARPPSAEARLALEALAHARARQRLDAGRIRRHAAEVPGFVEEYAKLAPLYPVDNGWG